MRPLPILYVHDVAAARRFYEALGMRARYVAGRDSGWVELESDGALLALHRMPEAPEASEDPEDPEDPGGSKGFENSGDVPESGLELAFVADEPLEKVTRTLTDGGYAVESSVADEAFGRSVIVRDPVGRRIQVNWMDPELRQPG